MLKPFVLAAAVAPVQAGPTIFVGAYPSDCCDPDPGPRDSRLRAVVDGAVFPLSGDIVKPQAMLGTELFGLPAYPRGSRTDDLRPWGGQRGVSNTPTASGAIGPSRLAEAFACNPIDDALAIPLRKPGHRERPRGTAGR